MNLWHIPDEIKPVSHSWGKVVFSILIPVLILVVFNFAVCVLFETSNPNRGYHIIEKKWALLEQTQKDIDILVLGDSSGNQGFDCDEFESMTGKSALNLCTIGNMLCLDDVWMLQTFLRHNDPPKVVLIIHVYDVWCRQDVPVGAFQRIPKNLEGLKPKPPHNYNPFARYLPLYFQHRTIMATLFRMMKNGSVNQGDYEFGSRGFMKTYGTKELAIKRDLETTILDTPDLPSEISQENVEALFQLKALADNYGFDVYVANSPLYDQLVHNNVFWISYEPLIENVEEICRSYDFNLINNPPLEFPVELMENGVDHVNIEGAKLYTKHLSDQIQFQINSAKGAIYDK